MFVLPLNTMPNEPVATLKYHQKYYKKRRLLFPVKLKSYFRKVCFLRQLFPKWRAASFLAWWLIECEARRMPLDLDDSEWVEMVNGISVQRQGTIITRNGELIRHAMANSCATANTWILSSNAQSDYVQVLRSGVLQNCGPEYEHVSVLVWCAEDFVHESKWFCI